MSRSNPTELREKRDEESLDERRVRKARQASKKWWAAFNLKASIKMDQLGLPHSAAK